MLAHCADQTHAGDIKSDQGYRAMDIVDTDRCEAVREEGGIVSCFQSQNSITGSKSVTISVKVILHITCYLFSC